MRCASSICVISADVDACAVATAVAMTFVNADSICCMSATAPCTADAGGRMGDPMDRSSCSEAAACDGGALCQSACPSTDGSATATWDAEDAAAAIFAGALDADIDGRR